MSAPSFIDLLPRDILNKLAKKTFKITIIEKLGSDYNSSLILRALNETDAYKRLLKNENFDDQIEYNLYFESHYYELIGVHKSNSIEKYKKLFDRKIKDIKLTDYDLLLDFCKFIYPIEEIEDDDVFFLF